MCDFSVFYHCVAMPTVLRVGENNGFHVDTCGQSEREKTVRSCVESIDSFLDVASSEIADLVVVVPED